MGPRKASLVSAVCLLLAQAGALAQPAKAPLGERPGPGPRPTAPGFVAGDRIAFDRDGRGGERVTMGHVVSPTGYSVSPALAGYAFAGTRACTVVRRLLTVVTGVTVRVGGADSSTMTYEYAGLAPGPQEAARMVEQCAKIEDARKHSPPSVRRFDTIAGALADMAQSRLDDSGKVGVFGYRDLWLAPSLPILVDPRLDALKAARAKQAWQTQDIDAWQSIAMRDDVAPMTTPYRTASPAADEALALGDTQVGEGGVLMTTGRFRAGPFEPAADAFALRLRVRRVVPKDMQVHTWLVERGLHSSAVIGGTHVAEVCAPREPPIVRLSLEDKDPFGDGEWHTVEIHYSRAARLLRIWRDGVLEETRATLTPGDDWKDRPILCFGASGYPVLFADIQVNLKRAAAAPPETQPTPDTDPSRSKDRRIPPGRRRPN